MPNRVSRITTAKGRGLNRDTIHGRHMTMRHRAMAVDSNERPFVRTIWTNSALPQSRRIHER